MKTRLNTKKWFVIERVPDLNYVMAYTILNRYGRHIKRQGGGDYLRHIMIVMRGGIADLCYRRDEISRASQSIAQKAIRNPQWLKRVNAEVKHFADEYWRVAHSLNQPDLETLSDRQLINQLMRLIRYQVRSHGGGQTTTWMIEADNQPLSTYLLDTMRTQIRQRGVKVDPVEAFSTLTTPVKPSFVEIESRETLILVAAINADQVARRIFQTKPVEKIESAFKPVRPYLLRRLRRHQQRWFWLHHNYRGPVLKLDYFLQVWQGIIRSGELKKLQTRVNHQLPELKRRHTTLLRQLAFDPRHQLLFKEAANIVWLKSYRKDCQYFGSYVVNRYLQEIARRLYLSFNQVEFLTSREYGPALLKKKFDSAELKRRAQFSVIYGSWDSVVVYTEPQASRFLKTLEWEKVQTKAVNELQGQPASPGIGRGKVCIVETVADIKKMRPGDIMLSETTYPALVPAMKKAAAIVTNVGGLTCHAAIVSRELKIPCIVGTKIATQVFKDGDRVEVDATNGVVRKL